jgi:branched-chain amino acid aminotransferase
MTPGTETGSEMLASVDGLISAADEAVIPVTDQGLIRGDGVFEVMRLYGQVPFALDEHMERLIRSGERLRLPVDSEAVRTDLYRLLAEAGAAAADGQVRIMLTRGGRRILLTEELHGHPELTRLLSVTYSPTRVLDGIKSLSYAANMLCGRLAREQGYDDALMVTPHGRVLEAPTSSVFYAKDGKLFTPPLEEHILASITRAMVMSALPVQERATTLEELLAADEVFLSSTTSEVQPVVAVDETEFQAPGPLTAAAQETVAAEVERRLAVQRAA